jgi:hypothetical protein
LQLGPEFAYALACLVAAVAGIVLRYVVLQQRSGKQLPAAIDTFALRPAELAYLLRGGDMPHTMIVLVADLVQRAVKESEGVLLEPYERALWEKIKEHTQSWMRGQVDKVLPNPKVLGPWQFIRRVGFLYKMIADTVRAFAGQVVQDPRRLRKYFSWGGILRLAADLYSAGYQQIAEQEIVSDLKRRGLLLDEKLQHRQSKILIAGAILIVCTLVAFAFLLQANLAVVLIAMGAGALSAVLLRLLYGLKDLIPLYGEANEVIASVKRPGWRVRIVRNLVRILTGVFFYLIVAAGVLLFSLLAAILSLAVHVPFAAAALLAFSVIIAWLPLIQIAFDVHNLQFGVQPSPAAQAILHEYRAKLSQLSPLQTFSGMLSNPSYDPAFSEILALYGIETLWILA